jgi:hypothetical protein
MMVLLLRFRFFFGVDDLLLRVRVRVDFFDREER